MSLVSSHDNVLLSSSLLLGDSFGLVLTLGFFGFRHVCLVLLVLLQYLVGQCHLLDLRHLLSLNHLLGQGLSNGSTWIVWLGTPQDSFTRGFVKVEVAVRRLVAPQFVSFLLQHVVKDLHAEEKLFVFFLEVLLAQDLEGLLVGEWLASKRVSVPSNLVSNGAHQRHRSVGCRGTLVDRLELAIACLNVAVGVEHLLLILL